MLHVMKGKYNPLHILSKLTFRKYPAVFMPLNVASASVHQPVSISRDGSHPACLQTWRQRPKPSRSTKMPEDHEYILGVTASHRLHTHTKPTVSLATCYTSTINHHALPAAALAAASLSRTADISTACW